MELRIDRHDEQGFAEARRWMLGQFESWLRSEGEVPGPAATEMANDVGVALHWKWRYGDGDLSVWQVDDFEEVLLGWLPDELNLADADHARLPGSLAAFVRFMSATGLLAPRSSFPDQLANALVEMTDELFFIDDQWSWSRCYNDECACHLDDDADDDDCDWDAPVAAPKATMRPRSWPANRPGPVP